MTSWDTMEVDGVRYAGAQAGWLLRSLVAVVLAYEHTADWMATWGPPFVITFNQPKLVEGFWGDESLIDMLVLHEVAHSRSMEHDGDFIAALSYYGARLRQSPITLAKQSTIELDRSRST